MEPPANGWPVRAPGIISLCGPALPPLPTPRPQRSNGIAKMETAGLEISGGWRRGAMACSVRAVPMMPAIHEAPRCKDTQLISCQERCKL